MFFSSPLGGSVGCSYFTWTTCPTPTLCRERLRRPAPLSTWLSKLIIVEEESGGCLVFPIISNRLPLRWGGLLEGVDHCEWRDSITDLGLLAELVVALSLLKGLKSGPLCRHQHMQVKFPKGSTVEDIYPKHDRSYHVSSMYQSPSSYHGTPAQNFQALDLLSLGHPPSLHILVLRCRLFV